MFLVPPIPNRLKREKATVRDTCGWALCHEAFPQINHFNRELFGLVAERSAWSYKHNGAFDVWLKKCWLRELDCVWRRARQRWIWEGEDWGEVSAKPAARLRSPQYPLAFTLCALYALCIGLQLFILKIAHNGCTAEWFELCTGSSG